MGDFAGKSHLVRDDHHGHAFLCQLHHHVENLADHFGVERAGGFVEQHHHRVHCQRPGNRHALLLAARELAGKFAGMVRQFHATKQRLGFRPRILLATPEHFHLCEIEVVQHR